jgi:hypothetical protein
MIWFLAACRPPDGLEAPVDPVVAADTGPVDVPTETPDPPRRAVPTEWTGDVDIDAVGAPLRGVHGQDGTALAVAIGADVTGDGVADAVIGAPWADPDGMDLAGKAYVVAGPVSAELDLADADAVLAGAVANAGLGGSIAIVPDVDGDAIAELAIGGAERSDGGVWLFRGPLAGAPSADASLTAESTGGLAGAVVIAGGDADADGVVDLLVGARQEAVTGTGAVYVVPADTTGTRAIRTAAGARIYGSGTLKFVGASVAAAGDVDGDGVDDVWFSASRANFDRVVLVQGPVTGLANAEDVASAVIGGFWGQEALQARGIAGGHDLDADGYADVVFGDYAETFGTSGYLGAVYTALGPVSGTVDVAQVATAIHGEGGAFGYELALPGDVTGDGEEDLLASAPSDGLWGTNTGAVYVIAGPLGAADAAIDDARIGALRLDGEYVGGLGGFAVGDLDGDGTVDALVGCVAAEGDAPESGVAWLVLGSNP